MGLPVGDRVVGEAGGGGVVGRACTARNTPRLADGASSRRSVRRRDRGVGSRRPALHVSGREERPRSRCKGPSQSGLRITRRRSGVHAGVLYVADSHTTPAVLSAEGCRLVTPPSSFSSQMQALNAGSAAYALSRITAVPLSRRARHRALV